MKVYQNISSFAAYETYGDATSVVNNLDDAGLLDKAFEQAEIDLNGQCTFDELCDWLKTKGVEMLNR